MTAPASPKASRSVPRAAPVSKRFGSGAVTRRRTLDDQDGKRPWTAADNRAGLWFTIALDLQLLAGLWLYLAVSPLTQAAMENVAAAMRDPGLRFWSVEHPFGMVIALVLAHVGRVRIRKAADDASRHKVAAILFALAMAVILLSSPWPGTPNARPWFRW